MASGDPNRELYLRIVESRSDLDGRFTNIRRIGSLGGGGHFSLMFSALDGQTGRRVALKFFHPDKRNDGYRVECFERESTILEQLAGQRRVISLVAPKSGFIEELQTVLPLSFHLSFEYLALELALRDVRMVIDEARWTAERRLVAFRDMCRAVARLHDLNIAHRDLKPGNFLVTRRGRIKLADFGTARRFDAEDQALRPVYGMPVGDVRYTSPEMLASLHDVDPRIAFSADIYSLGAILFELFTGRILGDQLFSDPGYLQGLASISVVKPEDRIRIYDQLLPYITNRELPSVADFGRLTSDTVLDRVDDLYRSMAALNFHQRNRLQDFDNIFRQIDLSLLMLRNHQNNLLKERDRARKEEWRRTRLARRARHAIGMPIGGGTT